MFINRWEPTGNDATANHLCWLSNVNKKINKFRWCQTNGYRDDSWYYITLFIKIKTYETKMLKGNILIKMLPILFLWCCLWGFFFEFQNEPSQMSPFWLKLNTKFVFSSHFSSLLVSHFCRSFSSRFPPLLPLVIATMSIIVLPHQWNPLSKA